MMQQGGGSGPVLVLSQNTKRSSGKKVQMENIMAAKIVGDVVRTCLGPKAMLKMLMDPMGGIVMTNDGNAILREITVQHPASKTMIEIARTQDEEVGDGTTSVIVLAAEILAVSQQFLEDKIHPTIIISAYRQCLEDIVSMLQDNISVPCDINNETVMIQLIGSCIGTKFISQWGDLACRLALTAVKLVSNGPNEIDTKRFARIEKVPGGAIDDSYLISGILLNKDVTHATMRRFIKNPRILLLDCNLEFKKAESQTTMEFMKEEDFNLALDMEETYIKRICKEIMVHKPDLVITEKGVSDLAQHFLLKGNVSVLRRVKKSDNMRLSRACGATIVNRTDEISESDIGKKAGVFAVRKIGDEYFSFIEECEDPKACTILLRGASKDILNEVERNLQDAIQVARNITMDARIVAGGGATEMALSHRLHQRAKSLPGLIQWPYRALARALEILPRTLVQNCGGNTIRSLTALRAKHATGAVDSINWGINGLTGELADMSSLGVWDPLSVKLQIYKAAIETTILLLRIDDIVSGSKKKDGDDHAGSGAAGPTAESMKE